MKLFVSLYVLLSKDTATKYMPLQTSALFVERTTHDCKTHNCIINTNYLSIYSAVGSAPKLIERPKEPKRLQPKRPASRLSAHVHTLQPKGLEAVS